MNAVRVKRTSIARLIANLNEDSLAHLLLKVLWSEDPGYVRRLLTARA